MSDCQFSVNVHLCPSLEVETPGHLRARLVLSGPFDEQHENSLDFVVEESLLEGVQQPDGNLSLAAYICLVSSQELVKCLEDDQVQDKAYAAIRYVYFLCHLTGPSDLPLADIKVYDQQGSLAYQVVWPSGYTHDRFVNLARSEIKRKTLSEVALGHRDVSADTPMSPRHL